ncbi:MAG: hypothetical protein OER90_15220 [Gemmatimonadota bacterium]|nr:hypothetical protein [Gemmatimonadota bacterium]
MATFRGVSVFLMETLARWVPTTPELEAKILMGRHIWEFAQHADQFGRRTHELRAALHFTRAPVPDYAKALDTLVSATATGDRIDGFYDVILLDVASRYRSYLEETDTMVDEPSVRILERVLTDIDRMRREREAMQAERPDLPRGPKQWLDALRRTVAGVPDFVDYREGRN